MRWLPVYNMGLAVVGAAAVTVAIGDRGAGAGAEHWTKEADARRQLFSVSARATRRPLRGTRRWPPTTTCRGPRPEAPQRLAAEIDATRKLRRTVVTGRTVVSYVAAGTAP